MPLVNLLIGKHNLIQGTHLVLQKKNEIKICVYIDYRKQCSPYLQHCLTNSFGQKPRFIAQNVTMTNHLELVF